MKRLLHLVYLCLTCTQVSAQHNALWIWNTKEILKEPSLQDTLLYLRKQLSITTLYVFLPHTFDDKGKCSVNDEHELTKLLRWMKENRFFVHALGGEPEWALASMEKYSTGFIDAVLAFQKSTGLLDGIQLDIEPYLLLPFSIREMRLPFLREWISVLWKLGRTIRSNSSLSFGTAIPFWLEDSITVDGINLPVARHIINLTDYIAVMAYRNRVQGNGGIVDCVKDEMGWTTEINHELYIGVETQKLDSSQTMYLCAASPAKVQHVADSLKSYASSFYLHDMRISGLYYNSNVLLGISAAGCSPATFLDLQKRLNSLFHATPIPNVFDPETWRRTYGGEYEFPQRIDFDEDHAGYLITYKTQTHSTFYDYSKNRFLSAVNELDRFRQANSACKGIAFHDFNAVLKLLQRNNSQ